MLPAERRALHVADAPIDVKTAPQTVVSSRQRPVVVTLVHGTVPFARWPRIKRLFDTVTKVPSRAPVEPEPPWYKEGSPFWNHLSASLGPLARLTTFPWSGKNTVWDRIVDAGAEGDFGEAAAESTRSLRAHIAKIADPSSPPAQVLVAHSHGGNVCLYALRDPATTP